MAESRYVPVGALALSTLDCGTLLRKLGQWGARDVARYARAKLIPQKTNGPTQLHNPYLQPLLKHEGKVFRNLWEVAAACRFPVVTCNDQNAPESIAHLKEWSPDLIIFTGGNILRKPLLAVPRLGVLNVHLGLLPEIRGMSSPEWSLLKHVPVGITIHYINAGIDTGPILQRYQFPDTAQCESLSDLRNRLIAFGVEKATEVVAALDRGMITAKPQSDFDSDLDSACDTDNQFFVMHEWLRTRAAERFTNRRLAAVPGTVNG
jgi:folate-dependent phosphoribosylglycinamide formyltransferase PurN